MDDDGLDGIVIVELLELVHHRLRRKDDTVQIDYADAVSKAFKGGGLVAGMHRQIHQREYGQYKEEERSSSDHHPEQRARTSVFCHKVGLV